MSKKALRWDGIAPLTAAAQNQWRARGFMFGGAPPMDSYYLREWLVSLATILGRPLEVADLGNLFRVKKESETLGGRRHMRVVFYIFGDQHIKLLVNEGIAATIRRRDDILVSSVLVPASKFNQSALVNTLMQNQERPRTGYREWPRKRNGVIPMGTCGPGGDRKAVRGQLHRNQLRPALPEGGLWRKRKRR
jgi:hypothetical protein